jgi:hypothetical protein
MKSFLRLIPYLLFLVVLSSCHRHFKSNNFDTAASRHKVIAILPAQVILTGKKPVKLTREDIARIEEVESTLFQQTLYNNILRFANTKNYYTTIQIQSVENTRSLLEQKGVHFRDLPAISDNEICTILNVDAVVRMNIYKTRYMSGLASFGIDVASNILWGIPGTGIWIPGTASRTDDIVANCSVQSNGTSLWNDSFKRSADWSMPANDIVENITVKFARHFPYRQRK